MIIIDGSFGEGGGQIVRSSLALSMVTGEPVTIENIRARRNKPGLQRQHLTAVHAAKWVSEADVVGDKLNSQLLEFSPRQVRAGDFHLDIGSAGSTTLVLQTVLPALMLAGAPSTIALVGGTHNPLAPPFEFFAIEFLPSLRQMGVNVDAVLLRHGFYPAGQGEIKATVHPAAELKSWELIDRGRLVRRRIVIRSARFRHDIAQRECETVLSLTGWHDAEIDVQHQVSAKSPGNYVLIELEFANIRVVFSSLARKGVRAERIASQVVEEANDYLKSDAPVGLHLADQLLLPLGLAAQQGRAGRFRTGQLTEHSRTHISVLKRFLDVQIDVQPESGGTNLVSVSPASK